MPLTWYWTQIIWPDEFVHERTAYSAITYCEWLVK